MIPIHIEGAVAPVPPWIAKVSQRKAPGAISAIAFIVRPVRPKVAFISGALSAISCPYNHVLLSSEISNHAGSGLSIVNCSRIKGKLKFLMTEIDLLDYEILMPSQPWEINAIDTLCVLI